MARLKLSSGFTVIPVGSYVLQVVSVEYKEAFGKMNITMQTQEGLKHIERFSLLRNDGSLNEGAMNAFSYFARNVLNDFERAEIDEQELVGHFVMADVTHEEVESTKNPGKMNTYARLGDLAPSDGWVTMSEPAAPAAPATPAGGFDLTSLLG